MALNTRHPQRRNTRPPGTASEEEEEEEVERLSSQDAYLFPVVRRASTYSLHGIHRLPQIGSAVLLGLYLIVKYYGKEWITWLLQWYFTIAGVGSVGKVRPYHLWPVMRALRRRSPLSHSADGRSGKRVGRSLITCS